MSDLKLLGTYREAAVPGTIHNRVSEIMGRKRWQISDLQRAAGIRYHTAKQLFYGESRQITFEVLAKVCDALGVQVGDLFVYMPEERAAPNNGGSE